MGRYLLEVARAGATTLAQGARQSGRARRAPAPSPAVREIEVEAAPPSVAPRAAGVDGGGEVNGDAPSRAAGVFAQPAPAGAPTSAARPRAADGLQAGAGPAVEAAPGGPAARPSQAAVLPGTAAVRSADPWPEVPAPPAWPARGPVRRDELPRPLGRLPRVEFHEGRRPAAARTGVSEPIAPVAALPPGPPRAHPVGSSDAEADRPDRASFPATPREIPTARAIASELSSPLDRDDGDDAGDDAAVALFGWTIPNDDQALAPQAAFDAGARRGSRGRAPEPAGLVINRLEVQIVDRGAPATPAQQAPLVATPVPHEPWSGPDREHLGRLT